MPSLTPARRQAAVIRSASAAVVAIGFSQNTCLPASAAAMHCPACSPSADAISTASRSGSASRASRSVYAGSGDAARWRSAKSRARPASRLSTLHSSAPAARSIAGASALPAILPVAIIAIRMGRIVSSGIVALSGFGIGEVRRYRVATRSSPRPQPSGSRCPRAPRTARGCSRSTRPEPGRARVREGRRACRWGPPRGRKRNRPP